MATTEKKTIQWPQDSTYVDVTSADSLEFWSRRFRVSPGKLKQAVRTVGTRFKEIEQHLASCR